MNEVLNRLHLAVPHKRDDKVRLPSLGPASRGLRRLGSCLTQAPVETTWCVPGCTGAEGDPAAHSTVVVSGCLVYLLRNLCSV